MKGNDARYNIRPRGPFSLDQTIAFTYIDRTPETTRPNLLLGFCADDTWEPTAVTVSQPHDTVTVNGDPSTRTQVERILGLDVDATTFLAVGDRDPLIGRLQRTTPGLRPPQIHSAYEAAVFCILTARRSAAQARRMRTELARHAGTVLTIAGNTVTCLPPPSYLLNPPAVRGLDEVRSKRLSAVAKAALDGDLSTTGLAALEPEQARTRLEQIPGIGPFSSAIIVVRALGHTDYLAEPITELNALVGRLYNLGHAADADQLHSIAARWSPWRTWAQLYIRSAGKHLLSAEAAAG